MSQFIISFSAKNRAKKPFSKQELAFLSVNYCQIDRFRRPVLVDAVIFGINSSCFIGGIKIDIRKEILIKTKNK